MGIHRHSWFLFSCSAFQMLSPEDKDWGWIHRVSKPMSYYTGWSSCPLLHLGRRHLCPEDLAYETQWKEDGDQRRKNCQLQNIQGEKSGRECIWYYGIQIQGPVYNYGAAPRNSERNSIDLCGVSQHTSQVSTMVSLVVNSQKMMRWLVMVSSKIPKQNPQTNEPSPNTIINIIPNLYPNIETFSFFWPKEINTKASVIFLQKRISVLLKKSLTGI